MQPAPESDAPVRHAGAVDDQPVFFNPLGEGFFDDPYAHYAQLREHDPVHQSMMGIPICFKYSDIRRLSALPQTTLAQGPHWRPKLTFRALDSLEVAVNGK